MMTGAEAKRIVALEPEQALNSLKDLQPNNDDVNQWLFIAEYAEAQALCTVRDDWAELAVCAYERLALFSANVSAMYLRLRLIERLGSQESSLVRDPNLIIAWIRRHLSGDPIEAVRQTEEIKAALLAGGDGNDLVPLAQRIRRCGGALDVATQLLKTCTNVDLGEHVRAWLAIRDRLL